MRENCNSLKQFHLDMDTGLFIAAISKNISRLWTFLLKQRLFKNVSAFAADTGLFVVSVVLCGLKYFMMLALYYSPCLLVMLVIDSCNQIQRPLKLKITAPGYILGLSELLIT